MSLIPPIPKLSPTLPQLLRLPITLRLQHIPRVQQTFPHIPIHLFQPIPQLLIIFRILPELGNSIKDGLGRLVVGESLEDGAELCEGVGEVGFGEEVVLSGGGGGGEGLSVGGVGFESVEKPCEGCLVFGVFLAFDDDL